MKPPKMPTADAVTKNINIFLLGMAFSGLFTAYNTMGNIQQTIIDSAFNKTSADDPNSGYVEGKL